MASTALEIASKLITFPSLTPTHPHTRPPHIEACSAALDYLQLATRRYTHLSRRYMFDGIDNLWLGWKSSGGAEIPRRALYIGHIDVVPADITQWTSDPFTPRIANGRLYGRGATDMKGLVAAFTAAMNNCVAGNRPVCVDAFITSDEEWLAINGIKPLLEFVTNKYGIYYDAVLVGEASSIGRFGSHVATGRRGSLNVKSVVKGKAGHCGYRNSYLNPMPTALALGLAQQAMVFKPDPAWLAKTEIVVRDVKTNSPSTSMVASVAEVFSNIRYTGNYTPNMLLDMLKAVAARSETDDFTIEVEITGDSNPYLGIPRPGRGPELLDALQMALIKHTGQAASITQEGGTSDGRWVPAIQGDTEIIEFGPDTGPMHTDDEYVALDDLIKLQLVLEDTIPMFCSGKKPSKHATAA